MSDWNDARYEFYDDCVARGMSPVEAEKALDDKISGLLKINPHLEAQMRLLDIGLRVLEMPPIDTREAWPTGEKFPEPESEES